MDSLVLFCCLPAAAPHGAWCRAAIPAATLFQHGLGEHLTGSRMPQAAALRSSWHRAPRLGAGGHPRRFPPGAGCDAARGARLPASIPGLCSCSRRSLLHKSPEIAARGLPGPWRSRCQASSKPPGRLHEVGGWWWWWWGSSHPPALALAVRMLPVLRDVLWLEPWAGALMVLSGYATACPGCWVSMCSTSAGSQVLVPCGLELPSRVVLLFACFKR